MTGDCCQVTEQTQRRQQDALSFCCPQVFNTSIAADAGVSHHFFFFLNCPNGSYFNVNCVYDYRNYENVITEYNNPQLLSAVL